MNPVKTSWIKPRSILLATNLDDLEYLLPVAVEQAEATGATMWLLHVVPPEPYISTASPAYPIFSGEKPSDALENALAKVASSLKQKDLSCAYEVRRWYPVEGISDFVHEHDIDRLILGTTSKGKIGKFLLGSVAEDLIRSLDIPVCTVGPNSRPPSSKNPRKIMFATSLRHQPERSFQFAVDLASSSRAELTVLHVIEQERLNGIDAQARPKIEEMLLRAKQVQLVPNIRFRRGEPAEEILAECSSLDPDLLVLGALPASPMTANFRMGVAYRVIAQAPCPTFTVRDHTKTKSEASRRDVPALRPATT
jgi:nucleotide-binding universal stress UspA family protein